MTIAVTPCARATALVSQLPSNSGGEENAPTKKVGYNKAADLARGVSGYEGCKRRFEPADPDNKKVIISRENHSVTHSVAFRYMTELECIITQK